jgi:hypothetical protein
MDSLAIVSLLVCGAAGAATLAVGWRWLRRSAQPSEPADATRPVALPKTATATAAEPASRPKPAPDTPRPILDDEPTEPMMRTSWDSTMWPATRPISDLEGPAYAPTEPMPLRPE